ncbi:MAG TPA: hypothetical protein VFW90_00065, partial [Candidatus Saccharimonadales bacterium]|nr:hypothetical protein [Candidatus Saccharimonadales bacterium]
RLQVRPLRQARRSPRAEENPPELIRQKGITLKSKPRHIYVNVFTFDPWWVRWMSMRWLLRKVHMTFSGTRGFRRRHPAVTVFTNLRDYGDTRDELATQIATRIADVVTEEFPEIRGYLYHAKPYTSAEPVNPA